MTNIVSAQRRKENKMTNRDFYTAISNGMMNDEVKAFAVAAIEKLDARNTARKSKPSKTAEANAPIKEALFNYLSENGGKFTESDLGTVLEVSHNKAGSLARQLVAEGKIQVTEVKIPKVGKRKAYFIGTEREEVAE